jgi:hypothetical protein
MGHRPGVTACFEPALLAALRRGETERFELPPATRPRLEAALAAGLAGEAPEREIERALQLVVALEGPLGSPTAAEALRAVLRAVPEALARVEALARPAPSGGLDAARRFQRREGREVVLRAPSVPSPRTSSGLQVKDLLRTAPEPRVRRTSGAFRRTSPIPSGGRRPR